MLRIQVGKKKTLTEQQNTTSKVKTVQIFPSSNHYMRTYIFNSAIYIRKAKSVTTCGSTKHKSTPSSISDSWLLFISVSLPNGVNCRHWRRLREPHTRSLVSTTFNRQKHMSCPRSIFSRLPPSYHSASAKIEATKD